MVRKAIEDDYVTLQGGCPNVKRDGKLWVISHNYMKDKREVRTHISPKERGSVIIGGVEYETAFLWRFEGGPCERRSRSIGGKGYARRGERRG